FAMNSSRARSRASDVFQGVGRIDRIDVPNTDQIAAVIADVIRFQRQVPVQRALNAQAPNLNARRTVRRTCNQDAACRWVPDPTNREAIAAREARRGT